MQETQYAPEVISSLASWISSVVNAVPQAQAPADFTNVAASTVQQAYDTVKPTYQQAVADGVETAVETAQVGPSTLPFGLSLPVVLVGGVVLTAVIGVGAYVMGKQR
jgi:hypothetical protein